MRGSLFFNPRLLIERLALASGRARRREILRGTPAAGLTLGHIDSLELLRLLADDPPRIIYDIGANVGTWTCLAKSLYPHARVEAFEPLTQHIDHFRKWTAAWPGDITLHSVALGATAGNAEMNVTDFSDASSLLPLSEIARQEFKIDVARHQSVPVTTIDGLIAQGRIPPGDLMKLDVQGYELEVLRGAEQCLHHTRALICEISFRRFYTGQPLFADVLAFLAARGFSLHALGANVGPGTPLIQTDALFVRNP